MNKGAKLVAKWTSDKDLSDCIYIENKGAAEARTIMMDAPGCDLQNGASTYPIEAIQPGCKFKKNFAIVKWRDPYDHTFVLTLRYTDDTGTHSLIYHMSKQ